MESDIAFSSWKTAYYVRFVEELISSVYSQNNMRCPTHLSVGQEMVPSILSQFLTHEDLAVSSHRSHAHYLSKGGSLSNFFDELHGLPSGCSGGRGGSMHLTDKSVGFVGSTAIVGNTIPIGVGLGNAIKLRSSKDISVIYLGDGATEEGVFWESVQYAIVAELPCLFVIENNFFSVYTDINARQKNTTILSKLSGFSEHIFESQDHDFLEFIDIASSAVDLVRKGNTAFILADTFRYLEHCGPSFDDHLNYRSTELINRWKSLDILTMMESFLMENFSPDIITTHKNQIQQHCRATYNSSLERRNHLSSLSSNQV